MRKGWAVLTALWMGALANATPMRVPVFPLEGEKVFDVLWVAQQVGAYIHLEYRGLRRVHIFSVEGTEYRFGIDFPEAARGATLIPLTQPPKDWEGYTVVRTEDFQKLFVDIEPEWFDAVSPTAVRQKTTLPAATAPAEVRKFLVIDPAAWWDTIRRGANINTVACAAGDFPSRQVLFCGESSRTLNEVKQHLLASVPQKEQRVLQDSPTGFVLEFVLENGNPYAFRTVESDGKVRVAFALR